MKVEVRSDFLEKVLKVAEAAGVEVVGLFFNKDKLHVRGISTDMVTLVKADMEYLNKDKEEEKKIFLDVRRVRKLIGTAGSMEIKKDNIILEIDNTTFKVRAVEEQDINDLDLKYDVEVEADAKELADFMYAFKIQTYDEVAVRFRTEESGDLHAEYKNENVNGKILLANTPQQVKTAVDIRIIRGILKVIGGQVSLGLGNDMPIKIKYESMGDKMEVYIAPRVD